MQDLPPLGPELGRDSTRCSAAQDTGGPSRESHLWAGRTRQVGAGPPPPVLRADGPPHPGPGVQTRLGVPPPQMCGKCITTLNSDDTSTYKHSA